MGIAMPTPTIMRSVRSTSPRFRFTPYSKEVPGRAVQSRPALRRALAAARLPHGPAHRPRRARIPLGVEPSAAASTRRGGEIDQQRALGMPGALDADVEVALPDDVAHAHPPRARCVPATGQATRLAGSR